MIMIRRMSGSSRMSEVSGIRASGGGGCRGWRYRGRHGACCTLDGASLDYGNVGQRVRASPREGGAVRSLEATDLSGGMTAQSLTMGPGAVDARAARRLPAALP